jgi:hypothetical protein
MQLEHAMKRAWMVAPSSQRIVDDITALPRVLKVLIDNEGTAVDDLATRSGKRGDGSPVKNFQCKDKTELSEFHQDLQPAVEKMLSVADCKIDMSHLFRAPDGVDLLRRERDCVCNASMANQEREAPTIAAPAAQPTAEPVAAPTAEPVAAPTAQPTAQPTAEPTECPICKNQVWRAELLHRKLPLFLRLFKH